jgi:hypothetical protein
MDGSQAPWAADFSYAYYGRLLNAARAGFEIHPVMDAPRLLDEAGARPCCLLRHDVDVDLEPALRMAELEADRGARATYYFMVHSPLYRVGSPRGREVLSRMLALGHEVGVHFDVHALPGAGPEPSIQALEAEIDADCRLLEEAAGEPVRSLSFHRPLPQFVRGPLWVGGRVNAYARELMGWYLSDSAGRWRGGEPLPELERPRHPVLQLLVHPIWWGERHRTGPEALEEFFRRAAEGKTPEQVRTLDADLAATLGVRRSGHTEPSFQSGATA